MESDSDRKQCTYIHIVYLPNTTKYILCQKRQHDYYIISFCSSFFASSISLFLFCFGARVTVSFSPPKTNFCRRLLPLPSSPSAFRPVHSHAAMGWVRLFIIIRISCPYATPASQFYAFHTFFPVSYFYFPSGIILFPRNIGITELLEGINVQIQWILGFIDGIISI